jgi:hypothetical protein
MSDIAMAEQLWTRAHELVKRGEFADAVRDLAQAFQILQAANDPRLYEVHRRWTEVHQMYVEDGARQQPKAPAQEKPTAEAEAEAAANAGDLERAIALYQQVVRERPTHELARERLQELLQARARAHDLTSGRSVEPTAAEPTAAEPTAAEPTAAEPTAAEPVSSAQAHATVVPSASEDDWSDVAVDDSGPSAASPAVAPAASLSASEGQSASVLEASTLAVSVSMIEEIVTEPPTHAPSTEAAPIEAASTAEVGFDVKFSDEMSFADLNEPERAAPAQQAPAMAVDDAPIGMQSLDVPFSIGSVITAEHADELPVAGPSSQPPSDAIELAPASAADGPASGSGTDQVAYLNELLARVQKNRRVA